MLQKEQDQQRKEEEKERRKVEREERKENEKKETTTYSIKIISRVGAKSIKKLKTNEQRNREKWRKPHQGPPTTREEETPHEQEENEEETPEVSEQSTSIALSLTFGM